MKLKIYFTINDYDDYYIIEEETIEQVRESNAKEMMHRGLDQHINNMFSELIEE